MQTTETMCAATPIPRDNLADRFDDAVQRHVRRQTQAPLRMRGRFLFESPTEDVFAHLVEPELIVGWFSMVSGGSADHSQSSNAGTWGAGSTRAMKTWGMGELRESIHHHEAPGVSVYSVHSPATPIENHAGLLLLEPTTSGCILEWTQFFDFRGRVLKHMFPTMMLRLMNRGLRNLQRHLGGEGGAMEMVR